MSDDHDSIYAKVLAIHDEAIEVLKAAHIPPYPAQYQRQFNRIFDEISDAVLKNVLNQDLNMDDKINSIGKYIELAQTAIETFSLSHSSIALVATQQSNLLISYQNVDNNTDETQAEFIHNLVALGLEMTQELQKSEKKLIALNEQLDDILLEATIDPLTHLFNYRKYMEDFANILSNGIDRELPLLSIMINGDDFKSVNSTFGHTAGDKVLYFLAQTIKSMVRSGDVVYRYGGDQIALIINRCDKEYAMSVAEKILHKVERSHLIYSGKTIQLTISIGATMHTANDTIDTIIDRTQKALSKSKEKGKNRITLL